jgi:methyl-accepting chemotaxis protein
MGLGLLLIVIGTSLIGLGGLGYFVYQELLSSSRREVDRSAEAQTRQLESKLTNVQQTVDGVAIASKVLLQQQPRPRVAAPFQRILVESLQNANSVSGMGITSNGNLLFPPAKPLVPYVWKEQSGLKPETSGQKLAAPNDKLLSGDRPDIPKAAFYQETLKGKASWSQPYSAVGKTIITYSAPISDGQKVVGIVNADAIASEILSVVDTATQNPTEESKIGFVVASSSGKVISASSQFQASETQNPSVTQALTSLAQQAKTEPSGITQTGGYIWAYRKIAGSDLLVAAQLPESEITNKLIILVGGAAVGISVILAIAILGFVNSLKKRLQPLTEECDRFLSQQGSSGVNIAGKDEIDHLGLSLKSTFQQVKTNEIRLRSELSQASSADDISMTAQIQQNFAETELMEAEVGDLLDVVSSMEEGDLTIEAQVNDRATGLVADTLNRLREKLVEIISSVLGTAQQVAQGAADLEELTRTVVLNTAEQAQSVTQGQALTEQVAAIAERSAAQVNVANQSLQEVRDTVASGQTSINTLTDSISVLQTGSAQIVQRMKTLGEFVGLAEQFVQDQGQIASLTQVLALNATLVAARAAEQKDPKQFSSVAREFESIAGQVNDLATQTNDGLTVLQQRTSQIQTVVTAIDAEVQNLSGLVAGFTSGVESSQSAFNSIQVATEEVVQIGQAITESSAEIADAAGSTASYISEIAQLADRTADLTRSARQQAEAMGNQAQQLLQGIQFFRLPESSGFVISANNAIASDAFDSPDTSANNLFDSSTESSSTEANNLGLVVPAIAVAATAFTLSQTEQNKTAGKYASPEEEDNTATDGQYLENLLDEGIGNDFAESHANQLSVEQSLDSISEDFISEEFLDNQNQEQTVYSDQTEISLIEESLLADLKQEIYDESSLDEISLTEASFKNPMEGVNESAIHDAASDPMIVSATSSFLEDTAFGIPSPLAEDANLHLPAFVDFTIPDLDDEDFHIPKMNIESTLDNSNSFFDSSDLIQDTAVDTYRADFDPFTMDDQTSMQPLIASDDLAIAASDHILTTSDTSIPVNNLENIADNIEFSELEDYSQFSSDNTNESLEQSIESSSNEAFSNTFDISFDESPFDRALDEALSDSLDQTFTADNTFDESAQDVLNIELADLPSQIPDMYLDSSSDDDFIEEFTFDVDENPLTNETNSTEIDSLFDSSLNQGEDRFTEEIIGDFEDQTDDYVVSMESSDLTEAEIFSEGFFDDSSSQDMSNQEIDELIPNPFDFSSGIQDDDSLTSDPQHSETSLLYLPDEQLEDLSPLLNEINVIASENIKDPFDGSMDLQEDILNIEMDLEADTQENALLDAAEQPPVSLPEDISESLSFELEDNLTATQLSLTNANQLFNESKVIESIEQDVLEDIDPFTVQLNPQEIINSDEAFVSEFTQSYSENDDADVSTMPEQDSETAFPSLFGASEDLEELDDFEQNWQSDIQEELPEAQDSVVNNSPNEIFDLVDFAQIEEMDNAMDNDLSDETFDEVFSLDVTEDFSTLTGSLNETSSMDLAEGLSIDEQELDYQEFINRSEANNFNVDENTSDFAGFTEDSETDEESILFSEISEIGNSIDNSEELEESVVFGAITENLVEDSSVVFPEFSISETSNLELDSLSIESIPDHSLEFSDNWFDEIAGKDQDNTEVTSLDDEDISIGYPSKDAIVEISDIESYGFADNLLNSLLDESDEKFDNVSMGLPDLETLPDFSDLSHDPFAIEDSENEFGKEPKFDFSDFDAPIIDPVNTARAEIDDFLSGDLGIPDIFEENFKPKPQETKSLDADNNPLQTDKPHTNEA